MRLTVDGRRSTSSPARRCSKPSARAGGGVPTLCFDERQEPFGACRVCMVGVEGAPGPVAACTTPCRDGMVVDTTDATARRIAAATVELVLSELPEPPPPGHRARSACARWLEVDGEDLRWPGEVHEREQDLRHPYLALRHELCISCGRCVRACDEVQGAFALTATGRGFEANIAAGMDQSFRESACVACGACADTCPTDAITEISLLKMQ